MGIDAHIHTAALSFEGSVSVATATVRPHRLEQDRI
jgi:hypothetical protein